MTVEASRGFYSSDEYRRIYEGEGDLLQKAVARFDGKYGGHIFEALHPEMAARGFSTVAEVGCAAGWNLVHFIERGYRAVGYDYSSTLVALGQSRGIDVKTGSVDDVIGSFDAIILNHVLEHLPRPIDSLRLLSQHLNPGGIMYIAVPNIDNFGVGQLQNAHIYYFSPRTFVRYLAVAGLKLLTFGPAERIHMYGIFEPAPRLPLAHPSKPEYPFMQRKILKARAREGVLNILDRVGVGETARTLYRRLLRRAENP